MTEFVQWQMRPENRERKRELGREMDARRNTPERRAYKAAKQRERYRANTAAHRAYYKNHTARATPPWLTPEHHQQIQWFYSEARLLGLTVDHIWPLKGKNSCGLHVPWNLQLLTGVENDQKGNKEPRGDWEMVPEINF
jgi:5-methylcytosine-specific restriction endonuclease McrA